MAIEEEFFSANRIFPFTKYWVYIAAKDEGREDSGETKGKRVKGSDAEFHYANDDDIETVFIDDVYVEKVSGGDDLSGW